MNAEKGTECDRVESGAESGVVKVEPSARGAGRRAWNGTPERRPNQRVCDVVGEVVVEERASGTNRLRGQAGPRVIGRRVASSASMQGVHRPSCMWTSAISQHLEL